MASLKSFSISSLLIICSIVLLSSYSVNGDMINQTITLSSGINLNVIFNANNVTDFESGMPVMLLHGFPEGWYAWVDLMPQLLGLGDYSFIVPDLPAFNHSQGPADFSGFNIANLVDDIASLIMHTAQPVTLIGHDWGGIVSWTLASKYPALINGLVILNSPNPSVWWDLIQTDPQQQNASSYIFFFEGPDGFPDLSANNFSLLAENFVDEPWFAPREDIYLSAWEKDLNSSLNYYRANIFGALGDWSNMQTTLPLNCTVEVPTLVLWGEADPVFIPGNYENLGKYVPNLQLETFPNGTHWIHHDIPEILAPIINTFVNSLYNQTTF